MNGLLYVLGGAAIVASVPLALWIERRATKRNRVITREFEQSAGAARAQRRNAPHVALYAELDAAARAAADERKARGAA